MNKREPHQRFLFEETCFLILFGYLPTVEELENFKKELSDRYELPPHYLESKILGFPSKNLMNKLQQEVLMLYSYDDDPDNISASSTMYKGLNLIAKIPSIVCYAYRSKVHYFDKESLYIHQIRPDLSIAENILYLLRDHKHFTHKEAEVLRYCFVLHADHGGGNNSTFTNVVISSTGTDIYSSCCWSNRFIKRSYDMVVLI
ncbi:MAG: citrate/2-methylcitrate synthase [Thomasclavelia sp.]